MSNEIWKPIPGFEGLYDVSNLGNVRSLDRSTITKVGRRYIKKGRVLITTLNPAGYPCVTLSRMGVSTTHRVHRLVAAAFIGQSNQDVDHKNGIRSDSRLDNLEYVATRENIGRAHKRIGRKLPTGVCMGKSKRASYIAKIKIDRETVYLGTFYAIEEAENAYKNRVRAIGKLGETINAPDKPE